MYRFEVIAILDTLRFTALFVGLLGSTYTIHLGLIEKRVVKFLLVLTELLRQVFRLRRYERKKVESRRFAIGGYPQNFRVDKDVPHQSFVDR